MKNKDRIEEMLTDIINEHTDNNNEFFYQKIMLCMIKLSQLFIRRADLPIKNGVKVAEEFWKEFVPNENFPTWTIDMEYAKLSKAIDIEKAKNQIFYARAARLMTRKFDPKLLDSNIDVFPLFVNYLVKMGCYKEDIAGIIEDSFLNSRNCPRSVKSEE